MPFQFLDKKTLTLIVKEIESKIEIEMNKCEESSLDIVAADLTAVARGQNAKPRKISLGVTLPNTMVIFERGEGSSMNLAGKSKG